MSRPAELALFERILLATDGTVTELIALYAGEPIRLHKIAQHLDQGPAPAELACGAGSALLHRSILLAGASRPYLHAESIHVLERLSDATRARMLETDRPIGLLWRDERLETFREVIRQQVAPCPAVAAHFGVPADSALVSRTYLVHHAQRPLAMITERWPLGHFGD